MAVCCATQWWKQLSQKGRMVAFTVRGDHTYLVLGNKFPSTQKCLFSIFTVNKESLELRAAFSTMATESSEGIWEPQDQDWVIYELEESSFNRICMHILNRDLVTACEKCADSIDLMNDEESSLSDSFVVSDEEEPSRKRSREE